MNRQPTFGTAAIPLLFFAIFLSFFASLSMAPLFDLDEGAFSEATREMLQSHNFITTYLNGELRFDKPILIYWLQALSVSVFGLSEWALRLPSALAATGWAWIVYRFTRRHFDAASAFWALFIMVTSLQITIIAKAAIADALLNLWIAVATLTLYDYLQNGSRRSLDITFAAIALGALTKGPVAILVPLATYFFHTLATQRWRAFFKTVFDPRGIAIFTLIALPWYIAEYLDQGMRFVQGFLFKHNLARFKGAFEGHGGTYLYYLPVLLAGLLPYTTLLLRTFGGMRDDLRDDLGRFLWFWFLFVFLFFSLSGTKLPHYVIYGYTPLFILMGHAAASRAKGGYGCVLPILLLFTVLLGLPEILHLSAPAVKDAYARAIMEGIAEHYTPWHRLFFAAAITILTGMAFKRVAIKRLLAAMGLLTLFAVNFVVIPLYGAVAQLPIKEAAALVRDRGLGPVVMYHLNTPSFILYSGRLVQRRTPHSGDIVLTKISALPRIETIGKFDTIYRKYGVILLRIKRR